MKRALAMPGGAGKWLLPRSSPRTGTQPGRHPVLPGETLSRGPGQAVPGLSTQKLSEQTDVSATQRVCGALLRDTENAEGWRAAPVPAPRGCLLGARRRPVEADAGGGRRGRGGGHRLHGSARGHTGSPGGWGLAVRDRRARGWQSLQGPSPGGGGVRAAHILL